MYWLLWFFFSVHRKFIRTICFYFCFVCYFVCHLYVHVYHLILNWKILYYTKYTTINYKPIYMSWSCAVGRNIHKYKLQEKMFILKSLMYIDTLIVNEINLKLFSYIEMTSFPVGAGRNKVVYNKVSTNISNKFWQL